MDACCTISARLLPPLPQVYKFYSEMISSAVSSQGQYATTHHNVKAMRAVKKETLKLIETYVSHATRETHVIAGPSVPACMQAGRQADRQTGRQTDRQACDSAW
eukprot:SAG22_NODE_1393_length_4514_cov_2.889468_2_plen_104_part_00